MTKRIFLALPLPLGLLAAYLLFWPVDVKPVAWDAPQDKGFVGDFEVNGILKKVTLTDLNGHMGPEALVMTDEGKLYTATHDGWILEFVNGEWKEWVNTNGRPLGLDLDSEGNLIAADAYRGLLRILKDKSIELLTDEVEGTPIKYANELDISEAGVIYFTDSSTKFGAEESGGTYEASLLDINEHGAHGRLLKYNPMTKETSILFNGINFANGVALDPEEQFLLVNETGSYRILKFWLAGDKAGEVDVLIDNLPGFPDNLSVGLDGRFWVGFPSPRNKIIDKFSSNTVVRRMIQRLPAFVRPKAVPYGHVAAFDKDGKILVSWQDPEGYYPITTGVLETESEIYISSLMAESVAILAKKDI